MDQLNQIQGNSLRKLLNFVGMNPFGAFGVLLLFALPFIPPFNQDYLIRWLIAAAIVGASAIAFDFSSGYLGIVNFGFAAFVGFGAYTSALISIHFGIPPLVSMLFGALHTAVLGFFTGIISLRMRGMFAICFTWFIGYALMGICLKFVSLTRGSLGLKCPYLFESPSNLPYYYIILIMMLVIYIVLGLMIRSRFGLAFKALSQNYDASRTSGIKPARYRIMNFTLSSAFAGWIGGFYAHFYGILTPDLLSTGKTVEVLVIAYIGGRGSLWGGMVVAFPFVLCMEMVRSTFSSLPGLNLVIYGVILIFIMIFYSGGIAQFFKTTVSQSKINLIRKLV